jgi:hypothetical protein
VSPRSRGNLSGLPLRLWVLFLINGYRRFYWQDLSGQHRSEP